MVVPVENCHTVVQVCHEEQTQTCLAYETVFNRPQLYCDFFMKGEWSNLQDTCT